MQYQHGIISYRPSLLMRFVALTMLLCTVGCGRQQIATQVTEFDKAVNTGANAIAAYYTGLNEQEYNLYFELLQLDPNFEVGDQIKFTVTERGQSRDVFLDSPLKKPPFSMKAIQARIRTLKELTEYSKNLAALAGDESPSQFQANVTTLKDRLTSLRDTFQKLKDDPKDPDPKADKFLGPLSCIVGVIGKWYLEERRWSEIRKAIIEAEAPVNTVLDFIAKDLNDYVDPILDIGAEDRYTTAIVYYNLKRKNLNMEQRTAMLKGIRDYKTAFDTARLYKPSSVSQQMKQAHMALVKVAKSDRAPADLAALKAELELFKDDIEQLRGAVETLLGHKEDKGK